MPEVRRFAQEISIIPPIVSNPITQKKKKLRVAAYCRVSTDDEEQETSFQTQVVTYTNLINSKEEWEFVDIYADDGISGTMINKREDFKRMMKDAMNGKIDLILTKSISRFARNTVDTLTSIKKLREKNIDVYFEKERIHTKDSESCELIITLLASFAQEESRSISENVKWGKRKQMQVGNVHMPNNLYGYTKDKDEEFLIIEQEAKIITDFCIWFLLRYSFNEIKRMAHDKGYLTRKSKPFTVESIKRIIFNEKIAGDYLAQKTFSNDFMTKKAKANKGELPMYYIKNNHKGIISHEMREQILAEKSRREHLHNIHKRQQLGTSFSGKYAFSNKLECASCGHNYNRKTWLKRDGSKQYIWKCATKFHKNGVSICKDSPNIDETKLTLKIYLIFHSIIEDHEKSKQIVISKLKEMPFTEGCEGIITNLIELLNNNHYDASEVESLLKSLLEHLSTLDITLPNEFVIAHDKLMKYKNLSDEISIVNLHDETELDLLIRKLINTIKIHANSLVEVQFINALCIRVNLNN